MAEGCNRSRFVGRDNEMPVVCFHAELELSGNPGLARFGGGTGIEDSDVVQYDAFGDTLMIPAHIGAARCPVDDDRDAVELFVAGVEDVAGHWAQGLGS